MFVLSSQTVVVASGKKTERGLFPTKGDTTTTRHGLAAKNQRQHGRGNLSSKRRLSNPTSGCHSKVNCRGTEQ